MSWHGASMPQGNSPAWLWNSHMAPLRQFLPLNKIETTNMDGRVSQHDICDNQ